jgi:hypothetical protein
MLKVDIMAIHFKQHQLKATRQWCDCYSRRGRMSILRAVIMTMHSRRHQLEVMRGWYGCYSGRLRI